MKTTITPITTPITTFHVDGIEWKAIHRVNDYEYLQQVDGFFVPRFTTTSEPSSEALLETITTYYNLDRFYKPKAFRTCVECEQQLTAEEFYYGHDCEAQ